MDESLLHALAAAARAFADAVDEATDGASVPPEVSDADDDPPRRGSAESMRRLLNGTRKINDEERRGVTREDARKLAAYAGMNPQGVSGYVNAGLLEQRDGRKWITDRGRERLNQLAT